MSVNAVMAQTFLPGVTNRNTGVTNRNTGVSRREIKFSISRRDNHALGVTLGRYMLIQMQRVSAGYLLRCASTAFIPDFGLK